MRKWISLLWAWSLMVSLALPASGEQTVGSMIGGLPTVEQFRKMDDEEQVEAYNRTQAAYDAYLALSEEEKAELEGAEETFDALFSYFNGQIMPVAEAGRTGKISRNDTGWAVAAGFAGILAVLAWKKK